MTTTARRLPTLEIDAQKSLQVRATEPAITFDHLTKHFGSFTAVDALTFSVSRGAICGFLGPNGAGKTTTLGMLLGIVPIDEGSASIFGYDVRHDLSAALQCTGALVERPAFYPYLSGRQNLALLARTAGIESQSVVEDTLETVGLTRRADAKFGDYSTGMKQRLGIAAALLKGPDLVVLDEPTSGLDPAGQREIRTLIREIASAGRTVILSSHLLHEVQEICTDVAIIDRGKLIAAGPLEEMLAAEGGIEVVVDSVDKALQVLRTLPDVHGIEIDNNRLNVDVSRDRIGAINRALVLDGIIVTELQARRHRLEERFLALTRDFERGEDHGSDEETG